MDHRHPHAALACASPHRGDGPGLSRALSVISGANRCAFPDRGAVCGAQCAACEAGGTSRRLAVGEFMAAGAGRRNGAGVAEQLAGGTAARLGDAGESPADGVGTRSVAGSVQRGRPFGEERWVRRLAKRFGMESTLRPRGRPKGA